MNLLINEPPLQVLPTLAAKIGLNNAIIIQQVHYWLRVSNNVRDGHKWVYRTLEEWHLEFPFWSKSTLDRAIKSLEEQNLLVVGNYNRLKMDRTKWYRINYESLDKLCNDAFHQNDEMDLVKIETSISSNCINGNRQNEENDFANLTRPITREYTENTTENTTEKKKSRKPVYDESSAEFQLANLLYEKIQQDDPSFKKPNLQSWSDHIRLMMERDERTEEQIRYLIEWSQSNSFWKSNILSTKKLREKATTLIRQIKAEKAKENSPKRYGRSREEVVPEWFEKRNQQQSLEPTGEELIDFEVEKQRILAKLGNG
ncbi:hypothetical protein QUF56_09250 [Ureibacillus composti]|nr:hypothetical protein [Ureibacillus composti]